MEADWNLTSALFCGSEVFIIIVQKYSCCNDYILWQVERCREVTFEDANICSPCCQLNYYSQSYKSKNMSEIYVIF
jgi:hypothetical protein